MKGVMKALSEIHSTFPDKPHSRAATESAIYQASLYTGLEFVDELMDIISLNPGCTSPYLAKFLNHWNNTIMGRLKGFGYKKWWVHHNLPPTIITKGC